MITAQDIREKSFEKAVFGGYDMAMVDEFMEEVAADLTLLQKENGILKSKMKVLVDKVDEYRGNEDALRNAVYSAQKLGSSIEQDAKAKASATLEEAQGQAEAILSGARAEAERLTADAHDRVKAEETRLEEARRASAEFIDRMDQLCRRELEFLQRVGDLDFMVLHRAAQQAASAPVPAPPAVPAQSVPAAEPVVQAQAAAPAIPAAPAPAAAESAMQPFPIPAAALYTDGRAEIHETVKSIEETVAKVMDEPMISVRPGFTPTLVEDERPTRSFNIITDPEDSVDRSTQFSLDELNR